MPTTMIIRHGEKPTSSKGLGYTDPTFKTVDSHSLTKQGWARAAGLVGLFNPINGKLRTGIVPPTVIYAADGPEAGNRMKETVSLLAPSLGLTTILKYDEGDEKALAKEINALPASAVVLVCWEHSLIPDLVKALGKATPKPPKKWADRFDIVWRFTPGAKGTVFTQIPELLLPSDSSKPMKLSLFQRVFG